MSEQISEFFCVFKTKLGPQFEVPQVPLNVQASYTEKELQQIVGKLLQSQKKQNNQDFDFLLNGELIRGTLLSYLQKQNIMTEQNIEIEYIKRLPQPSQKKSQKEENWINKLYYFEDNQNILALLFNSQAQIYDTELEKIKSVSLLENQDEMSQNILSFSVKEHLNKYAILQGSFFGELFLSFIDQKTHTCVSNFLKVNNTAITSITQHPFEEISYIGDQEGVIQVCRINYDNSKYEQIKENSEAHQSAITEMIQINEYELLTCSQDDTVKIFDTATLKSNYDIYFQNQTVTAVDVSSKDRLIYTGHAQGSIKLFDERVRNKVAKLVYESSNNYISQVKVNQESSHFFASSDYQGVIRLWDNRMTSPIYQVDAHNQKKIFSLLWRDQSHFLSGCEDGKVILHTFN